MAATRDDNQTLNYIGALPRREASNIAWYNTQPFTLRLSRTPQTRTTARSFLELLGLLLHLRLLPLHSIELLLRHLQALPDLELVLLESLALGGERGHALTGFLLFLGHLALAELAEVQHFDAGLLLLRRQPGLVFRPLRLELLANLLTPTHTTRCRQASTTMSRDRPSTDVAWPDRILRARLRGLGSANLLWFVFKCFFGLVWAELRDVAAAFVL